MAETSEKPELNAQCSCSDGCLQRTGATLPLSRTTTGTHRSRARCSTGDSVVLFATVDFFALMAGMMLLLAHLDTHHHRETINFLAHQRLGDRALLGQALERMDVIRKDMVTGKSAKLIRRLLEIEADAAQGSTYTARSAVEGDDMHEGEELRLRTPYLGVVICPPGSRF